jgi:hypothetical protein
MAQHDYIIANQSGAAFRSDLNNGLAAIVSQNSGAAQPSTTYAYQWWADTTTGLLKIRNAANNAWITLFQLDGEWTTLALENGTAAAPSLYFKDSGTDTGLFSPGANQLAISTGGVQRLLADASGNLTASGGLTVANLNGGPLAGTRNRIINGDMRIDQRSAGASVTPTTSGTYVLDRWHVGLSQASKFSLQQNAGSVTPPTGFTNYLGITSTSAYSVTAGDAFWSDQRIEGLNMSDLSWGTVNAKTVTLSFWVRSSLTGTFGGSIQNASSTRSYPYSYTISAANTWEQKTIQIPGDTTGTWATGTTAGMLVMFGLGVGATASGTAGSWAGTNYISATGATSVVGTSGATFYITGVQLEPGTVATPFERRSYGQELALCQRYFQLLQHSYGTANGISSIARCTWPLKVTMRAGMTLAAIGTPNWFFGGGTATYSSIGTNYSIPEMAQADMNIAGGSSTLGLCFSSASGGSGYFTASAEL